MEIPEKLLLKYDQPVPRYTSYPTANHFSGNFSGKDHIQLIRESNQGQPEHIAIYIHIPFCRKICFYCGCHACSIGRGQLVPDYMKALRQEIGLVSEYINKSRPVSQIHYGGGTPNAVDADMIGSLNEYICSRFRFISNPEIAIECNPAYLSPEYLVKLRKAGFNRFSLGIQDFYDGIIRELNREPSAIPVADIIGIVKEGNSDNAVNLDFIYGLPGQTPESFSDTIEKAIAIRPDRMVTFSYAHVPWIKKHQEILEKRGLPLPQLKLKMFLNGYNLLKNAGYRHIGLDHYVLPHDELSHALDRRELHRNFQGYCTRRTTGQVYAFGVSAISQLEKGYAQNTKDIRAYIQAVGNGCLATERGYRLNSNETAIRQIITDLMCNKHISWAGQASALSMTTAELKALMGADERTFLDFARDGLVDESPEGITVTQAGSLFIRNIAAALDPAYRQHAETYSKSV